VTDGHNNNEKRNWRIDYNRGIMVIMMMMMMIIIIIIQSPCLTSQYPLPKQALHRERSTVFSFNFLYPHISLQSSGSCLRLHPRRTVPSIFPSKACLRRQFLLHKMWAVLLCEGYSSPPWRFV